MLPDQKINKIHLQKKSYKILTQKYNHILLTAQKIQSSK